jgi:beta-galactosidase
MNIGNETGRLPWWGIAWYRKTLTLTKADAGRRIFVNFDGAMCRPKVYVNSRLAGEWAYGYTSFQVEVTDFVHTGDNTIAIRLENTLDSRWYPGGGIYRHVWLEKTDPVHVAYDGVFVTTPAVTRDAATVAAQALVTNQSTSAVSLTLESTVLDPEGKSVGSATTESLSLAPGASLLTSNTVTVARPLLWDIATPRLYTLRTVVRVGERVADTVTTPFGIRTVVWNAAEGFVLNGRKVPIQGVCNHHDLGPLGTAVNTRALERQLQILQRMGCNAIRTSHNPPAPDLLDLCDRMGFLVLDEAFDCWKKGKSPHDYSPLWDEWHERDLRALVRRDRNHPCVVLWSIGNEVPDQDTPDGPRIAKELTRIVHEEDGTRKVTAGCDRPGTGFSDFGASLEVFGFNYKPHLYRPFRDTNTAQPMFGSETGSTVSSRGEYFFPATQRAEDSLFNFQVSSYDRYATPWARLPDQEWEGLDRNPSAAGEFVWTGFDYLGEPTPYGGGARPVSFQPPEREAEFAAFKQGTNYALPSRSSYFGIIDICGFPKDRFYLYQSRWNPAVKMAHILPHWNWPDRVGQVTPVQVYSSGDEAELFLNGASLGVRKRGAFQYRFVWDDVVYAPGELKVVVSKGGQPWASAVRRTTGPVSSLALEPDRKSISADGRDLSFVTVRLTDAQGDTVPRTGNRVTFQVTGPAEIAAVDNGDPTNLDPLQASTCRAFNGQCLVILRSTREAGPVTLTATSEGLPPVTAKLTTKR